jgi:lysophospholipase L1-like esterase
MFVNAILFVASVLLVGEVVQTQGTNPAVVEGMEITCGKQSITVGSGRCQVNGASVKVEQTVIKIDPAELVSVANEWHVIGDQPPNTWHGGTRFIAGRSATFPDSATRPNPVRLVSDSVKVYEQEGERGALYTLDKDYALDVEWGAIRRLPTGSISENQRVAVSYTYPVRRIDLIEVHPNGQVVLKRGTPEPDLALVPSATKDCLVLATVYRAYHAQEVLPEHIFVVNPIKAAEVATQDNKPVAKTLAKLRAGQPVTIVCWGDSVTEASDVQPPEARYVNLFGERLRARFPKSEIKVINAGIGGTSTQGRLAAYQQEVLAYKPDLITVEFVNDMGLPMDVLRSNWASAVEQAKANGSEFVIITPHFVMPAWMNKPFSRGGENRPNCFAMRQFAKELDVGLADAAQRWEMLEFAGIPYETLELNGINHPGPQGQALFVDELLRLLPAK